MIILKGAFKVTLKKVYETILGIILFRFVLHYVRCLVELVGLGGFTAFFVSIFVNTRIRAFIIDKYAFYKKKYFPQYVKEEFQFDKQKLIAYDLKTIFSSAPLPEIPAGAIGMVPQLTKDDVKRLRAKFSNLKAEAEENLFAFIFHSATKSSLISLLTMIFVEYLNESYEINIFASLGICISVAFTISFLASLNYTRVLAKEWQEIAKFIENKDSYKRESNKKHILYVYNTSQGITGIFDDAQAAETKPENEAATTVTQRKDKKGKNKPEKEPQATPAKQQQEEAETEFLIGVFSNEIENEEHLKVKPIYFSLKFSSYISEVTETYFDKYLPHVLLTIPGTGPAANVQPGLAQIKSTINDLGNLFSSYFLLAAAQIQNAITKDNFFNSTKLKDCSFYASDYYDADGKLSKYFRLKKFTLHEKWNEFVLFLCVKFKVYEYKKAFASMPPPKPAAPAPVFDFASLLNIPKQANAAVDTPLFPLLMQNSGGTAATSETDALKLKTN